MSLDLFAEGTEEPRTVWVLTASGMVETTMPRPAPGAGPPGPPGPPGPAGGMMLTAFWQYAAATAPPPGNGQMRVNDARTAAWISEIDTDGMNRHFGLSTIVADSLIYVRSANGSWSNWKVTGPPIADAGFWTVPISVLEGVTNRGARTQLNFIVQTPSIIPAGGRAGQVLQKVSDADFDFAWVDP